MIASYRSTKPDHWTNPRPHTDASQRFHKHGPIQPMDRPATALDLLRHGVAGGLLLFALFIIGGLVVIAFSAASRPTAEAQHPGIEAVAGREAGR